MNKIFGDVFTNVPSERQLEDQILVENQMAIGQRIDEICEQQEMSQKKLAKLLGMHESQVSKIVSGCQNLTLRTLARIEARLRTKLIQVLPAPSELYIGSTQHNNAQSRSNVIPWEDLNPSIAQGRGDEPITLDSASKFSQFRNAGL
jgi:transcriptional regulator with XRE-family HTH domain